MQVVLNGEERNLAAELTVTQLLTNLELGSVPVLVERNGEALFPRDYPQTHLADGDRLEIVRVVAGG
ncbi:MAG: sulfur carrier protein ThiS [Verrucomicrobiota bacterium]